MQKNVAVTYVRTRTRAKDTGQHRRIRLRQWQLDQGRSFPWRHRRDPWFVFLAEMLLRRTRANQVAEHLPSVIDRFPTPGSMARARRSTVAQMLEPFGLRWRAATLHEAAKIIVKQHRGRVPLKTDALTALPGVGPYVASAVEAAAGGKHVLLVDTNTVRVATRVMGLQLSGDIRRRRDVIDAVEGLLGGHAPAEDWWAVLDLANAICRPGQPLCENCPINSTCQTGRERLTGQAN